MAPDRSPATARLKWRRRLIVAGIVLVALIGAYAVTTLYTRRPAFCNTCHEMSPYYDAWRAGPHAEVSCVECHVDPGPIADLLHKPYELREVWLHFTTTPTFPLVAAIELPDSRCLRCHPEPIEPDLQDFDHAQHRAAAACKTCHDTAGHAVSADALKQVGALNTDAQRQHDNRTFGTGTGTTLSGHAQVLCSDCHDMAGSSCSACHTPPAGHYPGECSACHTPSQPFASATFEHPPVPGGEHTYRSFDCAKCHPGGPPEVNCTCHGGNPPTEED